MAAAADLPARDRRTCRTHRPAARDRWTCRTCRPVHQGQMDPWDPQTCPPGTDRPTGLADCQGHAGPTGACGSARKASSLTGRAHPRHPSPPVSDHPSPRPGGQRKGQSPPSVDGHVGLPSLTWVCLSVHLPARFPSDGSSDLTRTGAWAGPQVDRARARACGRVGAGLHVDRAQCTAGQEARARRARSRLCSPRVWSGPSNHARSAFAAQTCDLSPRPCPSVDYRRGLRSLSDVSPRSPALLSGP